MSDKNRTFTASAKTMKTKRLSTVSGVNTRKNIGSANTMNEKPVSRAKANKNATIINDCDVTMRQETALPNLDAEYRQIAYGKFLRTMLEDCLIDEKIEREETDMEIQISLLADRFKKTMDQLDKTSRRLKDISFVVEHKRLLDLKSQDCANFYEMTDKSKIEDLVNNVTVTEMTCLDKLETNNVDFGYNKESGHKQLLDAVNEAIDGLEQIKKHSKLDIQKFQEYEKSETNLKDLEKDRFDLESLKLEFDAKFPKFSEKLIKEASEKVAMMMLSDNENAEADDE